MNAATVNTAVDIYEPIDRDTARAAALELRGRGLTPRDIGEALGLAESVVRALLLEPAR